MPQAGPNSAVQDRFVLKASPRLFDPGLAALVRQIPAWAWLLVAVLLVLIATDPQGAALLMTVLIVIALLLMPHAFMALNTRVVITPAAVESRDAWRLTSSCSRSEIVRAVQVPIDMLSPRFILTRVLLLDSGGRARLSLHVDAWSDQQLDAIRERLGLPWTTRADPVSPWQINREFPGAASIALRLWPLLGLALFAVAAVAFGLIVQLTGGGGRS